MGRPRHLIRLWLLLRTFAWIGAASFGGGMLAHFRSSLVTRHKWLKDEEFLELWSLCSTLPGLNSTNMAVVVGNRVAGWPGAVVSLAAFVLPGFVFMLTCGALFASHNGVLKGVAAAAAGLQLTVLVQVGGKHLRTHTDAALAVTTFILVRNFQCNMLEVLFVMIPLAWTLKR